MFSLTVVWIPLDPSYQQFAGHRERQLGGQPHAQGSGLGVPGCGLLLHVGRCTRIDPGDTLTQKRLCTQTACYGELWTSLQYS